VITPNTAKRRSPAFHLEAGVVTAIIVEPKPQEHAGDQQTVDEGGDLQAHDEIKKGKTGS
jgi:hypothetical protein